MSDSRSVSPSNTLFVSRTKRQRSEHAEAGAEADAQSTIPPQPYNYYGQPLIDYQSGNEYQYDIHEQPPDLPTNDPSFKKVEELNEQIVDCVLDTIKGLQDHGEEFANLVKDLQKKRTVNYGRPIRIGVTGDSGMGKSSAMNCLLGKEGLTTTVSPIYEPSADSVIVLLTQLERCRRPFLHPGRTRVQ